MLVMLEPTTLPNTIWDALWGDKTAAIEVTNSGNEVPIATKVIPITKGGIPKANPMRSAALIKSLRKRLEQQVIQ